MSVTALRVSTRPVTAGDERLLRALYLSALRGELLQTGWSADAIESFSNQQFDAQQRHFAQAYPRADHRVILADGDDVGQLMLDRAPGFHTLVDISVFAHARGRGIGTVVLGELVDDADRHRAVAVLSVVNDNPARRLYARMGFVAGDADDIRTTMVRTPVHAAPTRKDTT